MILQLDPPLPVLVPEKRAWGWAHLVTWNSVEHSLYWTIFVDSGEIWTAPNEKVRAYAPNWTAERDGAKERWPFPPAAVPDVR